MFHRLEYIYYIYNIVYNTFEHPVLLFGHSLLSKEFCKVVVVLFLDRVGRDCVGSFGGAAQFVSP